ncbi:MAG TPA: DUF2975 domain-containing protein [Burkholderiaceae bacterium]|jgi:hypothetical protein|nr:DUF2975 domain-containing protein [Burkholderiaceae bacterium]
MKNLTHNSTNSSIARIRTASRFLQTVFLFCIVALVPLRVAGWLLYDPNQPIDDQALLYGLSACLTPADIHGQIDLQQRLLAMAASALPTAVAMFIFARLARLFSLYRHGQIFTAQVVQTIRQLGFAIIVAQFSDLIFQLLCSIVLTWHNGVGHRQVTVGFSFTHCELLFFAAIVILSSWVMDEGRRLQAEQDLTI